MNHCKKHNISSGGNGKCPYCTEENMKYVNQSMNNLDLTDKESIVKLMQDVQIGNVSCRAAASRILSKHQSK